MTRSQFISKVSRRISSDCGIPVNLSVDLIKDIIDDSKEWFYENFDGAIQSEYVVISGDLISTDLFKAKRQILLPECVRYIYELRKAGAGHAASVGFSTATNPDFRKLSYVVNGYGNRYAARYDLVYSLTEMWRSQFLNNHLALNTIRYDYNHNTNIMTLLGHNSGYDMIAEAGIDIDDESLYSNIFFFKYVLAELYQQAEIILSIVDVNLVGGNKINTQVLGKMHDKYMKEIERELDDQGKTSDFFIIG